MSWRLLAPLMVLALVLAGCAADDSDDLDDVDDVEVQTEDATQSDPAADDVASTPDAEAPTEDVAGEDPSTAETEATEDAESEQSIAAFESVREAATYVTDESAPALAAGLGQAAGFDGVDSEGAALQEDLAATLQGHVYLAAITLEQLLKDRPDAFAAAAESLAENTERLAGLVGSVAPDQQEAFQSLWENHIDFFVAYTEGAKAGDQAAKDDALAGLNQYRQDAGAFFAEITGGAIAAEDVTASLEQHVNTVIATIDGFAAGDTGAFDQLKGAADHVVDNSARALAGAIATAAGIDGVDTDGAALLTDISTTLQEHVYLASIALEQLVVGDQAAFEAAAATLDANSQQLADLVAAVAPDQRDAFLSLWRNHIGFFVDYTNGLLAGDEAATQGALDNLAQYRSDAGAFFADITGGALSQDAVAGGLEGHVDTVITAIDDVGSALA
jgi:hypothetical protein